MKIIYLILFTFIFANQVFSQNSDSIKIDSNKYYEDLEGLEGCRLSPEIEPKVNYEKIKKIAIDNAMKNNIIGTVVVQVLINSNSRVSKTKVLHTNNKILNQTAIDVIMNCDCYESAFENKQPIASWITIPIVFKLN